MAERDHETDSFIKEVEEDLRRDRIQKLWEAYGTYVLVAAAALVVGVYVYKSQETQRTEQSALAAEVYSRAGDLLELGNAEEAMKNFRLLAKEAPPGYAMLAQFRVLGDAVRRGQVAAALKEYDRLARDLTDPILAGYARLQGGLLRLDIADFTAVENHLRPLTGPGSPWRHSAIEAIGLAAYKAGRQASARREFERLMADRQTPAAIKDRAQTFLAMIAQGDFPAPPGAKGQPGQGTAPVPEAPKPAAPDKQAPEKSAPKPDGGSAGRK